MKIQKIYNTDKYSILNKKNCTNLMPKFKKKFYQIIFFCKTCSMNLNNKKSKNSICENCKFKCHWNHDLIEIGLKKKFICDCSYLKNCKFNKKKIININSNIYSKNFDEIYCNCNNKNIKSDLIQCEICENFVHLKCELDQKLFDIIKYFPNKIKRLLNLICKFCLNSKLLFIKSYYKNLIINEKNINLYFKNLLNKDKIIVKCNLKKIKNFILNNYKGNGILININWYKYFCKCNFCLGLYKVFKFYDTIHSKTEEEKFYNYQFEIDNKNIFKSKDLFCKSIEEFLEIKKCNKKEIKINFSDVEQFFSMIKNIY